MTVADAPVPSFASLLAAEPLSKLAARSASLRGRHWNALVRVALAVRGPDAVDEYGQIRWDALQPAGLDAPVTEDDLRAYLAASPPFAGVRFLASLFSVRDPRTVTLARLVELVAEAYPDALPEALPSGSPHDPLVQPLFALPGATLGEACARRKRAAGEGAVFSSPLQFATDEARGAYLRDAGDVLGPYELDELGRWLAPRAGELPAWIRAAYSRSLAAVVAKLGKGDGHSAFPYASLLDRDGVAAVLAAATKHAAVFAMVSTRLAMQGQPRCADGLCSLLDDAKRGRAAALALASMGPECARAAKAWLDARPAGKASKGVALARALAELPAPPVSLFAGQQYSLPRFGRDERVNLLAATSPLPSPSHAPTALATLEAALAEKPDRTLLPPEGFADLLQLVALDPWLADVPYAYERALSRGRLGHGSEPAALVAALDELSWDCSVTKHYPSHEWGIGHLLVWAGASRAVYLHAIARFVVSRAANVVGALDRHFGRALRDERPGWPTAPVATLLFHHEAMRSDVAWIGPPRVLARSDAPSASVELAAPSRDLWIRGEVVGATRFVLGFRGATALEVDVEAERWSLGKKPAKKGATPPLDRARGVRFAIEMARDLAYLAIDGALLVRPIEGLPTTPGPVSVRAEGDGARVASLELFEKFQVVAGDAAGELLLAPGKPQSHAEVAGQRSQAAAHLLAAAARVLEEPDAALAKKALAAMEGEGLEPWKNAATEGAEPAEAKKGAAKKGAKKGAAAVKATPPEAPPEFAVRSFEDVVRAFHDAGIGLKPRSKKTAVLRRGQAEQVDLEYASRAPNPATEDWGARAAVPHAAVYLDEGDELGGLTDKPEDLLRALARLPALCRKGRGTTADVAYVARKGQYVVASLQIAPPDGGDDFDDAFGWPALAAAWKVDEGVAWALLEGDEAALATLLGVRALPARVEWTSESGVTLGDW